MADSQPYGDVAYADPGYQKDGKKRYPIDTAEHVRAAWSYINQGDNAGQYSSEQLANIKGRIRAAAKKFGIDIADGSSNSGNRGYTVPDAEERRYTAAPVELRGRPGNRTIGGYAAMFQVESRNLGGFKEVVAPIAFNRARSQGFTGVVSRYNHDKNYLLGSTASGRLRLGVDDTGLTYDVDVPESRSDVYELVERGDLRHSSFRFVAAADDWGVDDTGYPQRTLVQVSLLEVGPVDTPAYAETSVGLRSLARKFDANLEEVRSLAAAGDLKRFFTRTDTPTRSAHAALAKALSMDA